MKIGLLFAGDFEEGNGGTSRVKAHAKGISEWGEDVSLIILHAASPKKIDHKKFSGYWEGLYYEFLNRSNSRPQTILNKLFDSLKSLVYSTAFLLRKGRSYDAFYLYSPKPLQVFHVYLILKFLKVPLVVEMAERYSTFYDQDGKSFLKFFHKYLNWIHERLMNFISDHLIVISSQLYGYYNQFISSKKLSLIPISVDLNRFAHVSANGIKPFRIGYLGSFGSKDGVPDILKAFQLAHHEIPDLKLRLMGLASNEVEKLVDEKSLKSCEIEYTGHVTYDEIPDRLKYCDLLIVNRPNTAYANYGFPTKLGEYLASGKPVIATNVGDMQRYMSSKDDIILVDPEEQEQLSKAIINRYHNYDWYNQLGVKGSKSCSKYFDYRSNSKELCKVFYQVTGNTLPDFYKGLKLALKEKGYNGVVKETIRS